MIKRLEGAYSLSPLQDGNVEVCVCVCVCVLFARALSLFSRSRARGLPLTPCARARSLTHWRSLVVLACTQVV